MKHKIFYSNVRKIMIKHSSFVSYMPSEIYLPEPHKASLRNIEILWGQK